MKVHRTTLGLLLHSVAVCNAKLNQPLKLSTDFPSVELASELAHLSNLAYEDATCAELEGIPVGVTCHDTKMIDENEAMTFSSDNYNYIVVAVAGTDAWQDLLTDIIRVTMPFGPTGDPYNADAYVHQGFNQELFDNGFYDWMLESVQSLMGQYPDYAVLTTGHSLGAAQATMAATALALDLGSDVMVESINYASPRIGIDAWKSWVDSISNLGIWRFVYQEDIVPRLPVLQFWHVGHTIQLDYWSSSCYYLHIGDEELGYAGRPWYWQVEGTNQIAQDTLDHFLSNYIDWIDTWSMSNPDRYYVDSFEEATKQEPIRNPYEHIERAKKEMLIDSLEIDEVESQ